MFHFTFLGFLGRSLLLDFAQWRRASHPTGDSALPSRLLHVLENVQTRFAHRGLLDFGSVSFGSAGCENDSRESSRRGRARLRALETVRSTHSAQRKCAGQRANCQELRTPAHLFLRGTAAQIRVTYRDRWRIRREMPKAGCAEEKSYIGREN